MSTDDELQDLWLGEHAAPEVDLDRIREAHLALERVILRRNRAELAVTVILVVVTAVLGGFAVGRGAWGTAVGWGLLSIGTAVVGAVIRLRGRKPGSEPEPEGTIADFVEAHRASLRYQARLLTWVPVWYLGPLVPGLAVLAGSKVPPAHGPGLAVYVATWALMVVAFVAVGLLNAAEARRLRQQAAALPHVG